MIAGIREYLARDVVVTIRPTHAKRGVTSIYGVLAIPTSADHIRLPGIDPEATLFATKGAAGELASLIEISPQSVVDGAWERAEDHALGGDYIWIEISDVIISIGTAPT